MTFKEWCESYDDFEMFVGVNRLTHREVSEKAWDHQQQKLDTAISALKKIRNMDSWQNVKQINDFLDETLKEIE